MGGGGEGVKCVNSQRMRCQFFDRMLGEGRRTRDLP